MSEQPPKPERTPGQTVKAVYLLLGVSIVSVFVFMEIIGRKRPNGLLGAFIILSYLWVGLMAKLWFAPKSVWRNALLLLFGVGGLIFFPFLWFATITALGAEAMGKMHL